MGLVRFKMPDVGEGVVEAEIVEWHIKAGDQVNEDDLLVDVMTDKATVEIPAPTTGVIKAVHGEPGDILAVGSVLLEIETDGQGDADADPSILRQAQAEDGGQAQASSEQRCF